MDGLTFNKRRWIFEADLFEHFEIITQRPFSFESIEYIRNVFKFKYSRTDWRIKLKDAPSGKRIFTRTVVNLVHEINYYYTIPYPPFWL